MKLLEIYTHLAHDIAVIEREMEATIRSDHALLNDTSLHLLKAGGKRIRPVFVLLSGHFGDYRIDRLKKAAAALELIHMATLVHDDVIDDAKTRRGRQTVKAKWDNRIAMYAGDYIFAKALTVITELEEPRIHRILSKAIVQMVIGEMEQIRDFYNFDQSIRRYMRRIRRKTALLIAMSCHLGAITAGASERDCRLLYSFGYNVGMAFQIRDDILDLTGTEKQLGKPPGSDLKQGNITLPVILTLQDNVHKQELLHRLEAIRAAGDTADADLAIELVREGDGVMQADTLATRYIDKAIAVLQQLPDLRAKRHLMEIAKFVVNRSY